MKFDDAVQAISRVLELRRISGAHVVDHRQLSNDELKAAIIKAKPQYLHEDTVRSNLETVLYKESSNDSRVLSRLILVDVLLNQYDFELPFGQTEEQVIAFEQSVVNRSNEIDLVDLVRGQKRIVGSYYGSASPHVTFAKMVEFYRQGKIDVDGLITRRHPLDEINEAFELLAGGADGRGVIVF